MGAGEFGMLSPASAGSGTVASGPGQLPPYNPVTSTTGAGSSLGRTVADERQSKRPLRIAAVATGGVIAVGVLVTVALVVKSAARDSGTDTGPWAIPSASSTAQTAAAPSVSAPAIDPAIDPASLPAVDTGKLSVTSSGGSCAVSLSGKWLGQTPVVAAEVPAGDHNVTCTPAQGTALIKPVSVRPGESARVSFVVPAPPGPAKKDPLDKWK